MHLDHNDDGEGSWLQLPNGIKLELVPNQSYCPVFIEEGGIIPKPPQTSMHGRKSALVSTYDSSAPESSVEEAKPTPTKPSKKRSATHSGEGKPRTKAKQQLSAEMTEQTETKLQDSDMSDGGTGNTEPVSTPSGMGMSPPKRRTSVFARIGPRTGTSSSHMTSSVDEQMTTVILKPGETLEQAESRARTGSARTGNNSLSDKDKTGCRVHFRSA